MNKDIKVEKIKRMKGFVEPEHQHILQNAELALKEYSDCLLDGLKKELSPSPGDYILPIPRPEDFCRIERIFYEDPMRLSLIRRLAEVKMLYERPRFSIENG